MQKTSVVDNLGIILTAGRHDLDLRFMFRVLFSYLVFIFTARFSQIAITSKYVYCLVFFVVSTFKGSFYERGHFCAYNLNFLEFDKIGNFVWIYISKIIRIHDPLSMTSYFTLCILSQRFEECTNISTLNVYVMECATEYRMSRNM